MINNRKFVLNPMTTFVMEKFEKSNKVYNISQKSLLILSKREFQREVGSWQKFDEGDMGISSVFNAEDLSPYVDNSRVAELKQVYHAPSSLT